MSHTANQTAHDPAKYAANASFVYSEAYTAPVLGMLSAQPGERISDLGCGAGELTAHLAQLVGPSGAVYGTDSNSKMLAKAADAYSALKDKLFQADAQALSFADAETKPLKHSFDAVFSNATLHWCKDSPGGVLEGVKQALKQKPEARFVGECGGFMNCTGMRSHLHRVLAERGHKPDELDPWYFPTDEEYKALLEAHGFIVDRISLNPRLTPLSTSLYGWLETFARTSFLAAFSDAEAKDIMEEVVKRCVVDSRHLSKLGQPAEAGGWSVMYVRLRFAARLRV